eukprot:CAMPEP_0169420994 /NCGR_PEP_ID=MMETSP1017-20121227/65937_1 /TAXON_ID=342587 /ORGANISM="Karlodinium micrum, Strain CCMP2283" /LENGTH=73 /DNA_ID=CAMNT_0009530015 /DNA_START=23 /DNA_END=244 /DNA_ORIENTATION=+
MAADLDFKVKEKAVLAHLLTIPEVSKAVRAQIDGNGQDAKALIREAVPHFPREILEHADKASRASDQSRNPQG